MSQEVSPTTLNLLVASKLPGIGKATLRQIASDSSFYRTPVDHLPDLHPSLALFRPGLPRYEAAHAWALQQLKLSAELGVQIIGYWDPDYPELMRVSDGAPSIFWYKGDIGALRQPTIAVIGTRSPTKAGILSARKITMTLAKLDICIVSGLALGVDTEAHAACVAANGRTVAVLAGGLESISPRRNSDLAMSIVRCGGGLLSEFPIGTPSLPANFVARDTTQAALASAVILVQTDRHGGSLHASRAITKMGRPLFVVAPIEFDVVREAPKIQGNLALLNGDARVLEKMGFTSDVSDRLIPLRSKDDYPDLIEVIHKHWGNAKRSRRR